MYVFKGKASSATITYGKTGPLFPIISGGGILIKFSSNALYKLLFLNTPPSL